MMKINSKLLNYSEFIKYTNLNLFKQFISTTKLINNINFEEKQNNNEFKQLKESSPLVDSFGRFHNYLRISIIEKCNLRCKYCMPEEGVELTPNSKLLTSKEIIKLAHLFASKGVNKIRLTGGEPTIRKDLIEIVSGLSRIEGIREIGITTNGVIINRIIQPLVDAGLTHLNVSLDSLSAKKYAQITRRDAFQKVWRGLTIAQKLMPQGRVKINCVIIRGINDLEIPSLVEIGRELNFNIRFIEFMPFAGNNYEIEKFVPYKEMLENIEKYFGKENIKKLIDGSNETSKSYQINGFIGKFGFISSMSEHFCGGCNRLRITADGNLKVCLHGHAEISLRDALRSGATNQKLLEMIGQAIQRKAIRHAGLEKLIQMADSLPGSRPMVHIGG